MPNTTRLERIIENLRQNVDFRYPDYKNDVLEALYEHQKLLEIVEKEAPQVYIKYLLWFHDNR